VAVALDEAPSGTGALQSRAEVPPNVPGTAVANRSPEEAVASQPPRAAAAAPPDGGSKMTTAVVSRGDTLWRISRLTYGAGERYAIVYRANRERIRDPNRIYPGQIFVLPMKAR
jgi:nucleoid-associated protein YgaU